GGPVDSDECEPGTVYVGGESSADVVIVEVAVLEEERLDAEILEGRKAGAQREQRHRALSWYGRNLCGTRDGTSGSLRWRRCLWRGWWVRSGSIRIFMGCRLGRLRIASIALPVRTRRPLSRRMWRSGSARRS